VASILWYRIKKNLIDKKVVQFKDELINLINSYLFEDHTSLSDPSGIKDLLNRSWKRNAAIEVLLDFEEYLQGESNSQVKDLFYSWELDKIVEKKLAQKEWYEVAKAIHICSNLELKAFKLKIQKYIDSDRAEVRQQAILYFVNISSNDPLHFLNKIKKPLTLWEQIYLEEYLKTNYKGPIPDFLQFFDSSLESVKAFAIRMIGAHSQFEHIPVLTSFLYGPSEHLKKAAMKTLAHLDPQELVNFCNSCFSEQSSEIQSLSLQLLDHSGNHEEVVQLRSLVGRNNWKTLQTISELKINRGMKESVLQLTS
jgi:hypothetical protein